MINQYSEIHEDEEIVEEKEETPLAPMMKVGFSIVGVFCCLFLLIGGIVIFASSCKLLNYKEVETTVAESTYIEKTRYNLDYEVDDELYSQDFLFEDEKKVGDKVTAYYDPENPEKIVLEKKTNIVALIVAIVSLLVMIRLLPLIFKYRRETKEYYDEIEVDDEE